MTPAISPETYVTLLMAVPALIGGWLAYGRGKNWLLWGVLCGIFPAVILVVWFTKPRKEVKGFFRRCGVCGEWIKWREDPCRYCAYRQEQERHAAHPDQERTPLDQP